MIEFLGITAVILILYGRTYKYNKLIDDPVPREGYLWTLTEKKVDYKFYDEKRSLLATFTNIGTTIATCLAIQMCWGWQAALLYAILPTNVSATSWTTGNYYQTTVLFVVTAYYFFIQQTWWGIILSVIFYWSALESTVSAIPLPFVLSFGYGWLASPLMIPLTLFLTGKRFTYGLKKRKEGHEKIGVRAGYIHWTRIFVIVKCISFYCFINFWPSRLGFFHDYCKDEAKVSKISSPTRKFYIGLVMIGAFTFWGWGINPLMTVWFLLFVGLYSQYVTFGQFLSERYMPVANVGFCVLMAQFLDPYPIIYAIIATLYFYRSHIYIPAWKHNRNLFSYSISNFPWASENYTNLASFYIERNQHFQAISPLLMAVKCAELVDYKLYTNLANCYGTSGLHEKALVYTRMAHQVAPASIKDDLQPQIDELERRIYEVEENRQWLQSFKKIRPSK